MNKEQMEGSWKELKGKIKEKWGDLTDDEIASYEGRREQFFGALERRYGVTKERAEEQLREWQSKSACCSTEVA